MHEQSQANQLEDIVSLDTAAAEFSMAFGAVIAKLIVDKLALINENKQLRARILTLQAKSE